MKKQGHGPRRPVWIWIISIFYFGVGISGLMAIAMALVVKSQGPGPAGEVPSVDSLMHSSLWGLLPAANIAGAATLFFLRKTAFFIFCGLFVAKLILQILFELPLSGPIPEESSEMILGYVVGYVILLAVCIYTWHLRQNGILK